MVFTPEKACDIYELGNRFYDEQSKNLENPKAKNSYVYFNMHDEYNVFGGVRPVVRALAWELKLLYEKTLISPDGMDKTPYLRAEKLLENYFARYESDEIKKNLDKEKGYIVTEDSFKKSSKNFKSHNPY